MRPIDHSLWMDTMSDLTFLLITFFVMLICISSLDAGKVRRAFQFFDSGVHTFNAPEAAEGSNHFIEAFQPVVVAMAGAGRAENATTPEDRQVAARDFLQALALHLAKASPLERDFATITALAQKLGGALTVQTLESGVAMTVSGQLLFPDGSDELDEQGRAVLRELSTIFKLWGGKVEVVADWPWHDGPHALGRIAETIEQNWIPGESIQVELNPVSKQAIRFVLREEGKS